MEGGEKPHTDKYREIMHDWKCDRSCTLTSLPVWHVIIKIIYANTRSIRIIISLQLPLLSPHTSEGKLGSCKFSRRIPYFFILALNIWSYRSGNPTYFSWREYASAVVLWDRLKYGNVWTRRTGTRTLTAWRSTDVGLYLHVLFPHMNSLKC